MRPEFAVAVKSSIDKFLIDFATQHRYLNYDLDGVHQESGLLSKLDSAVAWSLLEWNEAPADPRWHMAFEAGANTVNDKYQYLANKVAGELMSELLGVNDIPVYDYSGEVAGTELLGRILIKKCKLQPSVFSDNLSLKMVFVETALIRFLD